MAKSKRKQSRGKKIKPQFWVFCEGKTEEAYVGFLRSKYRIPIEIVSKITSSNINAKKINKHKKDKPIHPKDIDFLLFDADVSSVVEHLRTIDNTTLLLSNPSIELWFLLHYKNQTAHISTNDCIDQLSKRNHNKYKKGFMDSKLSEKLGDKCKDACKRAKKLELSQNPSSNLYELIETLEKQK